MLDLTTALCSTSNSIGWQHDRVLPKFVAKSTGTSQYDALECFLGSDDIAVIPLMSLSQDVRRDGYVD